MCRAGFDAINLAVAEHAEEVAALPLDGVGLPLDGVGLLRAEFMVVDALSGVHPGWQGLAVGKPVVVPDLLTRIVLQTLRVLA